MLFWRNAEIIFDLKPNNQYEKTKKDINNGTLKIYEVDMLGLKYSDDPIEMPLHDIANIKVIH